jgi:hypothetical protein
VRDLWSKRRLYHDAGIAFCWVIDPDHPTLRVPRFAPAGYQVIIDVGDDAVVRAEPFEGMDLVVAALFDDEAEARQTSRAKQQCRACESPRSATLLVGQAQTQTTRAEEALSRGRMVPSQAPSAISPPHRSRASRPRCRRSLACASTPRADR